MEVGIYRDGEKMTVELTLIARPPGRAFARRGEEAPGETGVRGLGIHVVTATDHLIDFKVRANGLGAVS